jgi:hypothetical protein
MFVKKATKHTLAEIFEEAKMIEFQMKGCKDGHVSLVKKEVYPSPRRGLLLNIPPGKPTEQGPKNGSGDIEYLQRMIKKLSNEIVDMKRSAGKETKVKGLIKPFLRETHHSNQLNLPQST